MNIEFVVTVVLFVVLAVVLVAYDQLVRKFKAMKSTKEEIEARARDKAVRIIEEARDKAFLILNEAKLSAVNNQQELDSKLSMVAEKQIDVYKEMLQRVSKNIEDEAVGEISDFRKVLETEVSGSEQNVARKIEEEYQETDKQIEEYKSRKMQEFDRNAPKVAREFVRIVTGKVLNLNETDQKELIKQALEEAIRDNVL